MFTGAVLSADQAQSIGLVQDVFDAESFREDVWSMATTMAARSATGLAFMKRMSRSSTVTDQGLDLEIEAAAHLVVGEDAREGLMAFGAKRAPRFTARP
jgi:enoyl-CoA hydratase/carnithine racemase